MPGSQTYPATAPQAQPGWAQPVPIGPDAQFGDLANAAAEARRRAAEGFTTLDYRAELKRTKRARAWKRFGIFIGVVVVLIAAAMIATLLIFSVNQVTSNDMSPVLQNGQVVMSDKDSSLGNGDVVAYHDGSTVVYGRVIAQPGSWINIMSDNTLVVSDKMLDNASAKNYTQSGAEVKISRQVPTDSYFVLGDSETATISSLANSDGFVATDQVIGKALYKVWPIANIGPVL